MKKKRVILHLGLPKCASTSLQLALSSQNTIDYVGFIPDAKEFYYSNKEFARLFDNNLRFTCDEEVFYKDLIHSYISHSKKETIIFSSESISLRFLPWDLPTHLKLKFIGSIFPSNTEYLFIYKHPLILLKSLYKEWVLLGSSISFVNFLQDIYTYKDISFFKDLLIHRFSSHFHSLFQNSQLNVLFLEDNFLYNLNQFLNIQLKQTPQLNRSISDSDITHIYKNNYKFKDDHSFFDRIEKHRAFFDIDNDKKYSTSKKRKIRKEKIPEGKETDPSCIQMIDFSLIEAYTQIQNDLKQQLKERTDHPIIEQYIIDLDQIIELSKQRY